MSDGETAVNTDDLAASLSAALGTEVVDTEVLHEALNLTIAVSTADEGWAYVVRRPRRLRHTDVFNDVRREYRVLERLRETAVPAPEPVLYCDDESIIGDVFLVTSFVEGEALPVGDELPQRFRTESARRRIGERLVDALADVHTVDADRVRDACDHHTPLEQVESASDRLERATGVTGRGAGDLRAVADWLRDNAPSDPSRRFVHGDYKPGNVLFEGADRPQVSAVLDWETAMLADPRTELGCVLLYWRDESDEPPPIDGIEERYVDHPGLEYVRAVNRNGFYPFTTRPGSPARWDLIARYEDATGIEVDDIRYFRAHAALVLGAVWEDIHRHRVEAAAETTREPLLDYVGLVAADIVDGECET